MESLAAVGFASNILQIVDFSAKVLSAGHQIHQAGSTAEHSELEVIVNDFEALKDRLKLWTRPNPETLGPLARDNQSLENLALEGEKIAHELVKILSKFRVDGQTSKFESALQAIKSVWNKRKIDETRTRLSEIREELQLRILITMKEERMQALDEATQEIVRSVLESKKDLAAALAVQTNEFVQQQESREAVAATRHNQLVNLLTNTRDASIDFEAVSTRIKAALTFQQKDDRFDDILDAHQRTLEWALERDIDPHAPWPNLYAWLRKDSGIYWVSGKAGSGKSTLMKFLSQGWRLREALEEWAGPSELLVLRFYFWNAGTDLQKSQEGLFRSLLLQAIEQAPSLIVKIFPERFTPGAEWGIPLTFHELRRAFVKLTSQINSSYKVAMLVDGLDEFDATRISMTELAEVLIAATKSTNFKALVSSRPLPAFEASFARSPKLRLHHLTHNDIAIYVNDKVGKHSRVMDLSESDPTGVQALMAEIVESASGVFLWVRLVVRSLLEGFQNYDTLEDLQKRLGELPRDLENLFRHMVLTTPPQYQVQASRILQILRLNLFDYGTHPVLYRTTALTSLGLLFAEMDEETVIGAKMSQPTEAEARKADTEVEGRLRSRCAGLLELKPRNESPNLKMDPGAEVVYIHKTVGEFLDLRDVWEGILQPTKGTAFDPYTALLRSLVMRIKRAKTPENMKSLWPLVKAAMHFARLAESSTKGAACGILGELDNAMACHFKRRKLPVGVHFTAWYDTCDEDYVRPVPWNDNFLAFLVRHGLVLYVQSVTEAVGKKSLRKSGRPILDYACNPAPRLGGWASTISPDMVLLLLQHGVDPNQTFNGFTPWQNALAYLTTDPTRRIAVLKHLILHGADPNAYIEGHTRVSAEKYLHCQKSCLRVLKEEAELNVKNDTIYVGLNEIIKLLEQRGANDEKWHRNEGNKSSGINGKTGAPSRPHLPVSKKQTLKDQVRSVLRKIT